MMVADRLRRKMKMTAMTRPTVSSSVNFTSATDSRIVSERSARTVIVTLGGSCSRKTGNSFLTLSTTSTTLTPGCFITCRTIARSPSNQLATLSFSTPS
jgi:hypothetical protein